MKRIKIQDVVQDVEQALAAVRADEVVIIEQEDGDNLVLITQQRQRFQRNPNWPKRKWAASATRMQAE
jgi:hypothetical protein